MIDLAPYRLPEGNVQIAFSGGRTSGFMLNQILKANGFIPGDRVQVTFQNTGRERPETLDFVQQCGSRWNCAVTWLEFRPSRKQKNPFLDDAFRVEYRRIFGAERLAYMSQWWADNATDSKFAVVNHNSASRRSEPFEALILTRMYLPNQQMRFCTIEMKVRTAKRFLMSLGWKHWINCVGLRADEPHRLNKPKPKDRWTVWTPLAAAGVGKGLVGDFWSGQPFDLRLPNVKGNCWLGNCDGCFLKSEASVAAFTRDFPEDAFWWEGMEVLISWMTGSSSAAFWSKRYTRADLREFMDRQGDWALSVDGVLCQADDGECMAA